jgi:hypothetical protein
MRFWPLAKAPQKPELPYAVFQTAYGSPENSLGDVPDMDMWGIQIDIYGRTAEEAHEVAKALRDAVEVVAYITRWSGEDTDPVTKKPHYQFDVDWYQAR